MIEAILGDCDGFFESFDSYIYGNMGLSVIKLYIEYRGLQHPDKLRRTERIDCQIRMLAIEHILKYHKDPIEKIKVAEFINRYDPKQASDFTSQFIYFERLRGYPCHTK